MDKAGKAAIERFNEMTPEEREEWERGLTEKLEDLKKQCSAFRPGLTRWG